MNTLEMVYEPITFNLAGNKYTPDFMHLTDRGEVVFVEIKGSKRQRGYRDARSKLRLAKATHPWFTFVECIGRSDNWTVEIIECQ